MSLSLIPNRAVRIAPYTWTRFQAIGGVEPYTYSVVPGGLGGHITSAGHYLSPEGLAGVDTIKVVDGNNDEATVEVAVMNYLQLFCDIIQDGMSLEDGRIFLWDQKLMLPTDEDLWIAVACESLVPYGNTLQFNSAGEAVQSVNMHANVQVDIVSRNKSAHDRKEEILMALNTVYSRQQQAINSFRIFPISTKFVNVSEIDGAAIPYRYTLIFGIEYFIQKTSQADYFDQFSLETMVLPVAQSVGITSADQSVLVTMTETSDGRTFDLSVLGIRGLTPGGILFADADGDSAQDASRLYWDYTNHRVGIGTASPTVDLDVNGSVRVRSLSTAGPVITDASGNLTSEATLAVSRGGTGLSAALTAGSIAFSSGTALAQDNSNLFWNDTDNRLGVGLNSGIDSTITVKGAGATSSTSSFHACNSSLSSCLIVLDNGAVGVGTNAPIGRLHVRTGASGQSAVAADADELVIEGPGASGVTFLTPNNVIARIRFGDPEDSSKGTISYDHANDRFGWQVSLNAPNGLWMNSSAHVGINTQTIGSRLTVRGGGATSATSALNVTDSSNNSALFVRDDCRIAIGHTSPTARLHISHNAIEHSAIISNASINVAATILNVQAPNSNSVNTNVLLVGSSIGTAFTVTGDGTTFIKKLGANYAAVDSTVVLAANGFSSFGKNGATATVDIQGNSAISSGVSLRVANAAAAITMLYCRNDGVVSIGHESPTSRLCIKGAGNSSSTSSLNVSDSSSNSLLFVRDDGNVGVGTATPTMKLQVSSGRFGQAMGAAVTAANDLTLGSDGNSFVITGNTQINAITTANWQAGSIIILSFTGTPTVKHNTAGGAGTAALLLAGGADFAASADDNLMLWYDGTNWREISRTVI